MSEPAGKHGNLVKWGITLPLTGFSLQGHRQVFETFTVRDFQLGEPPAIRPKIILGVLRPRMVKLAFDEGDGAITNILRADDVPQIVSTIGSPQHGKELVVKIFVCVVVADRPAVWIRPPENIDDRVILHFHLGGYWAGSPRVSLLRLLC